jgi:hypothetical protein
MLTVLAIFLTTAASFVGHVRIPYAENVYPVGSIFVEPNKFAPVQRQLDISNNNLNGPNTVLLNPIAINIYYGAAWTKAQRDLMDFFTTNLGSTPYYSTLQSLKNKDGATIAPLRFGGSFYDPVADATTAFGAAGLNPLSLYTLPTSPLKPQVDAVLNAYFQAKSIGGMSFDISKYDVANTVFNIVTSPQVQFGTTGACGFHGGTTLLSNGNSVLAANINNSNGTVVRVMYTVNAASLCNPFTGGYTNGQGGTAVIAQGAAPNDAAVDGVLGTLTQGLFATISDPFRSFTGTGQLTWFDTDDVHFSATNTPTYTNQGASFYAGNNYNENRCVGLDSIRPCLKPCTDKDRLRCDVHARTPWQ